jgi:hypothetical protein
MSNESMKESLQRGMSGLTPSVYYAESLVNCTLQDAWLKMLDYKAWNPDFANAKTSLARGEIQTEGELTLITLFDAKRDPVAEFYAETAKLLAPHHIVWYVYPKEGDAFRNFVDFALDETPSGVKFSIHYYAQNPLSGDALAQLRSDMKASLRNLTIAFKEHCEAKSQSLLAARGCAEE